MKSLTQLCLLAGGAVVAMLLAGAYAHAQMLPAPKVDPARGQLIATQVCAACHGVDGNSAAPANPRLAQQHSEYLYKQLLDYTVRQGQQRPARENAISASSPASSGRRASMTITMPTSVCRWATYPPTSSSHWLRCP